MGSLILVSTLLVLVSTAMGGGDVFGTERPLPLSKNERDELDDAIVDAERERSEFRKDIAELRAGDGSVTRGPSGLPGGAAPGLDPASTPDHG